VSGQCRTALTIRVAYEPAPGCLELADGLIDVDHEAVDLGPRGHELGQRLTERSRHPRCLAGRGGDAGLGYVARGG